MDRVFLHTLNVSIDPILGGSLHTLNVYLNNIPIPVAINSEFIKGDYRERFHLRQKKIGNIKGDLSSD